MRQLTVSVGGKHNARIKKSWTGSFDEFVKSLLSKVPETSDKASNGWVCGAEFESTVTVDSHGRAWTGPYRDSKNFVARHLLSLDYDHITPEDSQRILEHFSAFAHFAYTTWSHSVQRPRIRVWLPLSRPTSYDEFQAISRRVAADIGIELAARESHVPSQYMFRPAIKPFEEFQHWENTQGPWVDVDEVLSSYENWTDRTSWPHRAEGDGVHNEGTAESPLDKPGIVGAFCRAFSISDAIEKFELPYKPGSTEGRLTYTEGSRPDGAIVYDNDTKLHSHHDTDPARGQNNAFDLVRLHRFGWLDGTVGEPVPLADRPSSKEMARFARSEPAVTKQFVCDEGFEDLTLQDTEWDDLGPSTDAGARVVHEGVPAGTLPERITSASSKLTDQENARRIQRKFGPGLISIGKSFFCWTGTHWQKDDAKALGLVTRLSQMVKAEALKIIEDSAAKNGGKALEDDEARAGTFFHWSTECGQKSKISACEALLRSLLNFDAKHLNKAEDLLSCANGTLNLRTGDLKPHDPKDFITACSPIAYYPGAQAPRFQQFLSEIYNGDEEVVEFVKRWFGYCLTGATNEHKMVFHVGRGGNGKSTLMDLLKYVMGEGYYSTAPQKILALDDRGATPELAGLLGRRMVTIAETDENLELREGLVKQITGGDPITARHLFKDPFEFMPTHKLQVFTNFAPQIKSQDFAMWRRILLLNYPISYGDAAQIAKGDATKLGDPHLEDALRLEAPGVLAWLVEGAREWYQGRLQPPAAVMEATNKYRADQDIVGQFAKERLVADPDARTPLAGAAGAIFNAYRGWCAGMNCRPLGRNRLMREILRVMSGARYGSWNEGTTIVTGFTGISLTGDELLD